MREELVRFFAGIGYWYVRSKGELGLVNQLGISKYRLSGLQINKPFLRRGKPTEIGERNSVQPSPGLLVDP